MTTSAFPRSSRAARSASSISRRSHRGRWPGAWPIRSARSDGVARAGRLRRVGVLLLVALLLAHWPVASLVLLVASRLVLGVGESLCGTGAILGHRPGRRHAQREGDLVERHRDLRRARARRAGRRRDREYAESGADRRARDRAGRDRLLPRAPDRFGAARARRTDVVCERVYAGTAARPRPRARLGRLRLDRDLRHAVLRGAAGRTPPCR